MKIKNITTILLICGISAASVADAITGRVINSSSNGLSNKKGDYKAPFSVVLYSQVLIKDNLQYNRTIFFVQLASL